MAVVLSPRSLVAVSFISIVLIVLTAASAFCCSLAIHVLYNLVKSTSPGNGAKYRFWLQITTKNLLTCLFCHLFNIVVVIETAGLENSWSVDAVCYITGYLHICSIVLGLSFLCTFHFYQYLSVVVSPLEHPKYIYSTILWVFSWTVPMVIIALLPATTATNIQFSYNRMSCTFMRNGMVDHDTALLGVMATTLGFTCVFCASLTLKIFAALKDETKLIGEAKHISLFGDKLVKVKYTCIQILVYSSGATADLERKPTGVSLDTHRAAFKLMCLYALSNIVVVVPYVVVIFTAAATSGSVGREWEEFAILALRVTPLLDFAVLLQDVVFSSNCKERLKSLYCRQFLCNLGNRGKVSTQPLEEEPAQHDVE